MHLTHAHLYGFVAGIACVLMILLISALIDWLREHAAKADDPWINVIRELKKPNEP